MMKQLWVVLRIVPRIVQGGPYNGFYEPMKDYAKSPIYELFKFSSLESFCPWF
jgi:hypothetical protein